MDGVTGAQTALQQQQKDNSVENLQKQVENKKFTDALQTANSSYSRAEAPVELAGERPAANRQSQPARTPACDRLVGRQRVGVRAGCVLQIRRSRWRCR